MKKINTGISFFKKVFFHCLLISLFAVTLTGGATAALAASSSEGFESAINSGLDQLESWGKLSRLPQLKQYVKDKTGFELHPYYRNKVEYTSNVFSAPKSKQDVIFTFTPGVKALYQNEKAVVGAAYEADFDVFTRHSNQNVQNQFFAAYTVFKPTVDTYIRASEEFRSVGTVSGDSLFGPVDYNDNTVNIAGGYSWDEWTAQLGYENFNRDFEHSAAKRFSYNESRYDVRLFRQISETIRAFTGLRLGANHFSKQRSRDTTYIEIPVGLEGKLPWWGVMAAASVGYQHRNTESDAHRNFDLPVASVDLKKAFGSKTTTELSFIHRPVESAFENQTIYMESIVYAGVNHLLSQKLRGKMGISTGSRNFKEDTLTGARFLVGPGVFASTADVRRRHDNITGLNTGFDYAVRPWLILNMEYAFNHRTSNIHAFDSNEHRVSLGVTVPL